MATIGVVRRQRVKSRGLLTRGVCPTASKERVVPCRVSTLMLGLLRPAVSDVWSLTANPPLTWLLSEQLCLTSVRILGRVVAGKRAAPTWSQSSQAHTAPTWSQSS